MGWQDRDYSRPRSYSRGGFGLSGVSMWSVTTWLIVINVAVFVIDEFLLRAGFVWILYILPEGAIIGPLRQLEQAIATGIIPPTGTPFPPMGPLTAYGHFSAIFGMFDWQIWRFLSFQFLHAGIGHLFFNMLSLFFFGPMVESYLGRRRYVGFYLLCGISGAVFYMGLWIISQMIGPQGDWLFTHAATPLVGASAGIFGVLVAAAHVAPDTTVMLMFPPIPMRLKTLALGMLAIAAYMVITGGQNAGGEAAHLGGAALGFLLIRHPRVLNVFDFPRKRRRSDWQDMFR